MSVIQIYGSLSNKPTLRVLVSMYEHDLDFDFVTINMKAGQNKEQPFLSLDPFGEIPAIKDGELALFDSRTIMRYIAFCYAKEGKEHIFKEPLIEGIVACWIDIEDHKFDPVASNLISELIIKPQNGLKPNQQIVDMEISKLGQVLDVYEERLSMSKFLGGDKFTTADLTHLPNLYYLMKIPLVKNIFETRQHVGNWCNLILSRPAWVKVVDLVNNEAN